MPPLLQRQRQAGQPCSPWWSFLLVGRYVARVDWYILEVYTAFVAMLAM